MYIYIYTRMITPHWTWPFRQVAAVASASHPAVWAAAGSVRSVAGCGGFWRGHTSMIWDTNRYKYRYIVAFHNKTLWPYDDLMMTLCFLAFGYICFIFQEGPPGTTHEPWSCLGRFRRAGGHLSAALSQSVYCVLCHVWTGGMGMGQNPGTPGEPQNSWDLWMWITH